MSASGKAPVNRMIIMFLRTTAILLQLMKILFRDEASAADEEVVDSETVYNCTPGDTQECYEGPSGSKGVGICKAGISECNESGTGWSECIGMVLPRAEICGDGIDQNCDGIDQTVDNAIDIDGDGFTYCTGDCCETGSECFAPEKVNPGSFEIGDNGVDDNCNDQVDEALRNCDSGISQDTTDPMDLAKSMDLCPPENEKDFGVIDAVLLFPDGSATDTSGSGVVDTMYSVLTQFGTVRPHNGNSVAVLATGSASSPVPSSDVDNSRTCNSPSDWYQANGSKFPSSPDCGLMTTTSGDPINDPIMLKLRIRAPLNAESFSFDIFFFSKEFHEYVCTEYNDFVLALLDSDFSSTNPQYQNPPDRNLAMDANKNPLGVNLAMNGLFTVCDPAPMLAPVKTKYCQGSAELQGTGFEGYGATGWLVTRGNIIPGEEFEVRLAIWDSGDAALDSLILLDNFTWYPTKEKPGTDQR